MIIVIIIFGNVWFVIGNHTKICHNIKPDVRSQMSCGVAYIEHCFVISYISKGNCILHSRTHNSLHKPIHVAYGFGCDLQD